MKSLMKCVLLVSASLCIVVMGATVGTAFTRADVKHGEELVAAKDYKAAVETLSAITKDYDFCAMNPADAARANMFLCDAYKAMNQHKSSAYKTAAASVQAQLLVTWASTKKDAGLRDRLSSMAEVCAGHPDDFVLFAESILTKRLSTDSIQNTAADADGVLAGYKKVTGDGSYDRSAADGRLMYLVGKLYLSAKQLTQAIGVFRDVVADNLDATTAEQAVMDTVGCYRSLKDFEKAQSFVDGLISTKSPLAPNAMWAKGKLFNDPGVRRYNDAVACLRDLLTLYPQSQASRDCVSELVDALVRLDKVGDAVAVCEEQARRAGTGYHAIQFELFAADLNRSRGFYDNAEAAYRRVSMRPDVTENYVAQSEYMIGQCQYKRGMVEGANTQMRKVVSKYPNSSWAKLASNCLVQWSSPKKTAGH